MPVVNSRYAYTGLVRGGSLFMILKSLSPMNTYLTKRLVFLATLTLYTPVTLVLNSCISVNGKGLELKRSHTDTVPRQQKHLPEDGLQGISVAPGLKVETMAAEPTLINPTNIDIDEKGRVWVTEAYNYRFEINGNKPRPEGDRILILEDKDGDGKLETRSVFYQGPEINAPLGICVLSDKVIVSQSPYVWAFYDDDKDGKADRKEILFQGISGVQHDHGIHSFTSGPDGKFYFTFGNEGKTLRDKNNHVVLDQDGDEIGPNKYHEAMLFRADPDGTHVECLGSNFRNPYEAAVDSYGTIWQSDNDDDGNRGTRINYVMPYGNYGYKDEMTGATWGADRINIEPEIPLRHWHQNDPGIVPNLLQTGAGSPAGMVFYEGNALPQQFQNQIIHAEPGHNVVRSYPVQKNGAGYTATIQNILTNDKDQWFRPVDICVAPDGSLIVADWYDPGVGGHRVGDLQRGRIYRISATGTQGYKMPEIDYTTPNGAITALQNPNLAVRRIAFASLLSMGNKGIKSLEKLWHDSPDPRMRARALWVLSKTPQARKYLTDAIKDADPDIRITGLRAAEEANIDVLKYIADLVNDNDIQVRRECAIALRHNKDPKAAALWATLADKHNGNDRWYLEALGIGADRQWDSFFAAYLKLVPDPLSTAGGKDIIWRARTNNSLPYLSKLAADPAVPLKLRLRYFRAFDFYNSAERSKSLIGILEANNNKDLGLSAIVLQLLDAKDAKNSPIVSVAVQSVLKQTEGTQNYINLLKKFNITTNAAGLMAIVTTKGGSDSSADAARLLLRDKESQRFHDVINGTDKAKTINVLSALGTVGNTDALNILSDVALAPNYSGDVRKKAIEMMGKSSAGEPRVLELLKNKKLPEDMISPAVAGLSGTRTPAVLEEAKTFLPNASKTASKKAATVDMTAILSLSGSAVKGKAVFAKTCTVCHKANNVGVDFGPDLSEIGSKLPKEAIFDAIVNPSAGISFGYETWQLDMKDGSKLTGIVASRTETDIEIKYPGGSTQKIKTADVKQIKQLPGSMMPEGLHQTMTKQEFADLLGFLASLKKK
jgi:putative membrane-bound dehydrogenase-like protein